MSKRAILRLIGAINQGVSVTLEVQDNQQTFTEISGTLPANPELATVLQQWQTAYRRWLLGSQNGRIGPIEVVVETSPQTTFNTCRRLGRQLQDLMQAWLTSAAFSPIDRRLREALNPQDEAQVLLRTDNTQLHQLPWQVWDLLERYPRTEVVFASSMERLQVQRTQHEHVRILAILGSHNGELATDVDRQALEAMPHAEVHFVQPCRSEITNQLWEQSWDILFFAGHSYSEGKTGYISLSPDESLTIEELRYGLRRAIERGLQLAIFNSCDGLGLAYDLESLHIPQLIVMREPVPDPVAQAFLTHFLTAFSQGETLHCSIREARERLQPLDSKFAFATWLPILFQNPAVKPPTWNQLSGNRDGEKRSSPPYRESITPIQKEALPDAEDGLVRQPDSSSGDTQGQQPNKGPRKTRKIGSPFRRNHWLSSIGVAAMVMLLRYLGALQWGELGLYDAALRTRPAERPDNRFLMIEITDDYLRTQPDSVLQGRSIGDDDLHQLLTTLDSFNPSVIGLDIYRDGDIALAPLQEVFRSNKRLLTVCKGADPDSNQSGIDPPPGVPWERVGFSDVREDSDRIVRTQALSSPSFDSPPCLSYSFSAAIAELYLFEKKSLEVETAADTWTWSDTAFTRIGASLVNWPSRFFHYGPYAGFRASGFQILLNYRATAQNQYKSPMGAFPKLTIEQVLAGELTARDVEDRIVLIGVNVTAGSLEETDQWLTPYRTFDDKTLVLPGVHLQAQMASQIISAVLDDRTLLWALPFWLDGVIVIIVSLTSAVVALRWRSIVIRAMLTVGGGLMLVVLAWVSFTGWGLYLPLLPMLLGAGVSGVLACRTLPQRSPQLEQLWLGSGPTSDQPRKV